MTDITLRLKRVANASRRKDGTDIPLGQELREATAEIANLRSRAERAEAAAAKWRTMDSAPKDRTKFDVWVPNAFGGYRMTDMSFNQNGKLRHNGLLTEAELPRWPTHWMRHPSAPDAALNGEG